MSFQSAIDPPIYSSSQPHVFPFLQSSILSMSNHPFYHPANTAKKCPYASSTSSLYIHPTHTHLNIQNRNRGTILKCVAEPTVMRSAIMTSTSLISIGSVPITYPSCKITNNSKFLHFKKFFTSSFVHT